MIKKIFILVIIMNDLFALSALRRMPSELYSKFPSNISKRTITDFSAGFTPNVMQSETQSYNLYQKLKPLNEHIGSLETGMLQDKKKLNEIISSIDKNVYTEGLTNDTVELISQKNALEKNIADATHKIQDLKNTIADITQSEKSKVNEVQKVTEQVIPQTEQAVLKTIGDDVESTALVPYVEPKNNLLSDVFNQMKNVRPILNAGETKTAANIREFEGQKMLLDELRPHAEANSFKNMLNKLNEYGQEAKKSMENWFKKPSNNVTTARNTFFDAKADQEVIKQGVPVEGQVQTTPQSKLLEIYGSLLGGAAGAGVGAGIISQGLQGDQREAVLPYGDFDSLPYEAGMLEGIANARHAYIQVAEQEKQAELARIQAEEAARQALIAMEQAKVQEALAQASWKNKALNAWNSITHLFNR